METLYDVLGARSDDDAESLKSAYRKAAKANHPDHQHGDLEATARFTRIAKAYDILRDAKRREAYDRLLERQRALRSKARRDTSRPKYRLAFQVIGGVVVVGIVLAGGVRVYGIIGDDAGGITAGQPPRIARAPKIPVTQGAAASAVEGKGAWEAVQGSSAPDAAVQTTGRSARSTAAAAEPDRSEVAALLARGRSLLRNGDVAGARVHLRRAAEHNDPQAALALGETYDPVVLRHLGVIKFNGDVALAREWYSRAADLGSVATGDPGRDHGAEPPEGAQGARLPRRRNQWP